MSITRYNYSFGSCNAVVSCFEEWEVKDRSIENSILTEKYY
jgi:hypothetical protein